MYLVIYLLGKCEDLSLIVRINVKKFRYVYNFSIREIEIGGFLEFVGYLRFNERSYFNK